MCLMDRLERGRPGGRQWCWKSFNKGCVYLFQRWKWQSFELWCSKVKLEGCIMRWGLPSVLLVLDVELRDYFEDGSDLKL